MPTFLAEFLYSAILWGSLVTALLWWLKSISASRVMRGMIWVPLAWIGLHTAIAWYGFLLPPSGRLLDANSGEPYANQRVVATWMSYPLNLWTTFCSGSQAHLTDAEGDFAFRFAPAPTLLFGTLARGLSPKVPGRINKNSMRMLPAPMFGEYPIQRYAQGRNLSKGMGSGMRCDRYIAPQYPHYRSRSYPDYRELLPGEANPFDVMFREACVEKQPWTETDRFILEMMRMNPRQNDPSAYLPSSLQQPYLDLGGYGCQGGGACVRHIPPELRDEFCTYFTSLQLSPGVHP